MLNKNKDYIKSLEKQIDDVDEQLKVVKRLIADDKSIKIGIEFSKIKLLEKKFYLLAELRTALNLTK